VAARARRLSSVYPRHAAPMDATAIEFYAGDAAEGTDATRKTRDAHDLKKLPPLAIHSQPRAGWRVEPREGARSAPLGSVLTRAGVRLSRAARALKLLKWQPTASAVNRAVEVNRRRSIRQHGGHVCGARGSPRDAPRVERGHAADLGSRSSAQQRRPADAPRSQHRPTRAHHTNASASEPGSAAANAPAPMEVGSLDEMVATARSRAEARSAAKPKFKKGKPMLRQPNRKSQC
jgi:hypothetical protein